MQKTHGIFFLGGGLKKVLIGQEGQFDTELYLKVEGLRQITIGKLRPDVREI